MDLRRNVDAIRSARRKVGVALARIKQTRARIAQAVSKPEATIVEDVVLDDLRELIQLPEAMYSPPLRRSG